MPTIGQPKRMAMSMTFTIFSAKASPREPPNTVKSCENTNTRRPSTVPCPVTTPSPYGRFSIIPKFGLRCWTNASSSVKQPGSSSSSTRSRARSLPRSRWRSTAADDPACAASSRSRSTASIRSRVVRGVIAAAAYRSPPGAVGCRRGRGGGRKASKCNELVKIHLDSAQRDGYVRPCEADNREGWAPCGRAGSSGDFTDRQVGPGHGQDERRQRASSDRNRPSAAPLRAPHGPRSQRHGALRARPRGPRRAGHRPRRRVLPVERRHHPRSAPDRPRRLGGAVGLLRSLPARPRRRR